MITLTRLNTHQITVNCDLIRLVEASPDTMLTMVSGEKIVVLDTCEQVIAKVLAWRVELLRAAFGGNTSPAGAELAAAGFDSAQAASMSHTSTRQAA